MKRKIPVQKCVYVIPNEQRTDQKNLIMWVRIADLPADLSLDPNARRADDNSRVAKQIAETLREQPENFWKLNSGIQMTARDVEVRDGRTVVIELFDPEDDADTTADGVINGGHTYAVIKRVRRELEERALAKGTDPAGAQEKLRAFLDAVVRVEILTGIEQRELANISRARNTGAEVKKVSLQNLKRLFDPIKDALGNEVKNCGFCENDIEPVPGKTYQVTDLIRLMTLFNNQLYPYQSKHPVQCYTASGRLADKWETEADSYRPLVPMLTRLMRLFDKGYVLVDAVQAKQRGRRRNGLDKKEHVTLPFTGAETDYKISAAFVYPLVASLRVLLDGQNRWRTDPEKFLEAHGTQLVEVLFAFYDEQSKAKPHELGRSVEAWRAVASEARAIFAESQLQEQPTV
jgi:hypothetical protein